jgi:hypothetical protein
VIRRSGAWWASVVAACSAFACGDGTSRWILEQVDSGAASLDGGALPEADAGAADSGAADTDAASDSGAPLRDPQLFANACDPQISVDNRTADGRGALFDQAFPMPGQAVRQTAMQVCALLYERPDEVPPSPPIVLVIEDFYGIGEIGITAPEIHIRLSSLRMQSVAAEGGSVRDDVVGSLHYLLAIDYELDDENPGTVRWVTEGIAFWVRYRAGYASLGERTPGGSPTDDYKTAGFFFDWLDRSYPNAVYHLNQSLDPEDDIAWSARVFEQITGKSLATLWSDYQASL